MKPSEQIDRHIAGIADWRGNVKAPIAYNRSQWKGKKASDPAPKVARRPGPPK